MTDNLPHLRWRLVEAESERLIFSLPHSMIFLGREKCDVILPSKSVDKRHAVISYDHYQDSYKVKDLSTVNGTFVNGDRIPDQSYVPLRNLDTLRFGADATKFRVEKIPSNTHRSSFKETCFKSNYYNNNNTRQFGDDESEVVNPTSTTNPFLQSVSRSSVSSLLTSPSNSNFAAVVTFPTRDSPPPSPSAARLPGWATRGAARHLAECRGCTDENQDHETCIADNLREGDAFVRSNPESNAKWNQAAAARTPLYGQPDWWTNMNPSSESKVIDRPRSLNLLADGYGKTPDGLNSLGDSEMVTPSFTINSNESSSKNLLTSPPTQTPTNVAPTAFTIEFDDGRKALAPVSMRVKSYLPPSADNLPVSNSNLVKRKRFEEMFIVSDTEATSRARASTVASAAAAAAAASAAAKNDSRSPFARSSLRRCDVSPKKASLTRSKTGFEPRASGPKGKSMSGSVSDGQLSSAGSDLEKIESKGEEEKRREERPSSREEETPSETGTYTIEDDKELIDDKELEFARESIDKVFGVLENTASFQVNAATIPSKERMMNRSQIDNETNQLFSEIEQLERSRVFSVENLLENHRNKMSKNSLEEKEEDAITEEQRRNPLGPIWLGGSYCRDRGIVPSKDSKYSRPSSSGSDRDTTPSPPPANWSNVFTPKDFRKSAGAGGAGFDAKRRGSFHKVSPFLTRSKSIGDSEDLKKLEAEKDSDSMLSGRRTFNRKDLDKIGTIPTETLLKDTDSLMSELASKFQTKTDISKPENSDIHSTHSTKEERATASSVAIASKPQSEKKTLRKAHTSIFISPRDQGSSKPDEYLNVRKPVENPEISSSITSQSASHAVTNGVVKKDSIPKKIISNKNGSEEIVKTPSRDSKTMTKTRLNRAFDLRRSRLNSDAEMSPAEPGAAESDANFNFMRSDGGRFSLRSSKSSNSKPPSRGGTVNETQRSSRSNCGSVGKLGAVHRSASSTRVGDGSGKSASNQRVVSGKLSVGSKSRSQPSSRSSSPCSAQANSSKQKQAEQWQRRKMYDPLRAVAQAKANKRLQQKQIKESSSHNADDSSAEKDNSVGQGEDLNESARYLGENEDETRALPPRRSRDGKATRGFSEVALSLEKLTQGIGDLNNEMSDHEILAKISSASDEAPQAETCHNNNNNANSDQMSDDILFAIHELSSRLKHISNKVSIPDENYSEEKMAIEKINFSTNINQKLSEILQNLKSTEKNLLATNN